MLLGNHTQTDGCRRIHNLSYVTIKKEKKKDSPLEDYILSRMNTQTRPGRRTHTSYRLLCQEFSTPATRTNTSYLHILSDGQKVAGHWRPPLTMTLAGQWVISSEGKDGCVGAIIGLVLNWSRGSLIGHTRLFQYLHFSFWIDLQRASVLL